jgi:hypothetical protein
MKIYDLEKTICDVIHYRNKLGIDIVKEVLDNNVFYSIESCSAKEYEIIPLLEVYL